MYFDSDRFLSIIIKHRHFEPSRRTRDRSCLYFVRPCECRPYCEDYNKWHRNNDQSRHQEPLFQENYNVANVQIRQLTQPQPQLVALVMVVRVRSYLVACIKATRPER